ncbi:RluA family pseudouridine synthase [Candidatus Sumerlaeota bacterium]|nr:RluA family pseudouridine synthase [Candidatus Sumerlaeota bacterium]
MTQQDKIHTFLISEEETGIRIDRFLASCLPACSRTYIQRLIKQGKAFVNNKTVKSSYVLSEDDEIALSIPPPQVWTPQPEFLPLDIVYEDADILVVNKPSGMVVHPGAGNRSGTLVNALLYHCRTLSGIGGILRPGIVHRLDKGTSGLLAVAKTDQAHLSLVKQLADRKVKRIYLALVLGDVKRQKGVIDLPIGRDPHHRERMAVNRKHGKPAVTHYEALKRGSDVTLLEVSLETGRTHQIRVHMQYLGHPIIGDKDYGTAKVTIPDGVKQEALLLIRNFNKINHPLLHARRLELTHPLRNEVMIFEAPPPEDFNRIIARL